MYVAFYSDDDELKLAYVKYSNKFKEQWGAITKETAMAYFDAKDRYIAHQLFINFGCESVEGFYGRYYPKFEGYVPCEGGDRQCRFDCYMERKCKYESLC